MTPAFRTVARSVLANELAPDVAEVPLLLQALVREGRFIPLGIGEAKR